MKKIIYVLIISVFLIGCNALDDNKPFNKDKDITVVSREDGSGTRGAFIELVGIEEKNAKGNKVDNTTVEAVIANKTDVMMSNVSSDNYAIGYLSLGSLSDSIKALNIDGVKPTIDSIKKGEYKVARPFNIVFNDDLDEVSEDFINFIMSKEGQDIVEDNGYIAIDSKDSYDKKVISGKIVVAGSSSVSPIMEKLSEEYQRLNSNVTIEIQTSDSTVGIIAAIDKTVNIGMASRSLKEEEALLVNSSVIAIDGIVVVVNNNNPILNLSSEKLKDIYVGNIVSWNQIISD